MEALQHRNAIWLHLVHHTSSPKPVNSDNVDSISWWLAVTVISEMLTAMYTINWFLYGSINSVETFNAAVEEWRMQGQACSMARRMHVIRGWTWGPSGGGAGLCGGSSNLFLKEAQEMSWPCCLCTPLCKAHSAPRGLQPSAAFLYRLHLDSMVST